MPPKGETKYYYRKRQQLALTVVVDSPEFKKRVKAVADADGRAVNNWLQQYILPIIEQEVSRQEKKAK